MPKKRTKKKEEEKESTEISNKWLIEVEKDNIPSPYKKYPSEEIIAEFLRANMDVAKLNLKENWNLRVLCASLRSHIRKNGHHIKVLKRKNDIFLKKE